jgi:cell division protease FtsH
MRTWEKYVVICAVVVVAGTMVWNAYGRFRSSRQNVSLTQFLRDVDSGRVAAISIHGDEVVGVNSQTGQFRTYAPRGYVGFVDRLIERDVDVSVVPEASWWNSCAPLVLVFMLAHASALVLVRRWPCLKGREL